MSTKHSADDTDEPNTNTPALVEDLENPRIGHHGRMTVEVEVPPEIAVTVAARLGVEAMREDVAEVAPERADVWALDLIELQPTFTVNGPEGEVPLADYLHDRGVPVEPTDDSTDD